MEIYQDSSVHTPGRRHVRRTRKPLTPHHNHQSPMQGFRQSLKDATNSTNTSVKKKKSVLLQSSFVMDKENQENQENAVPTSSTTPSTAQSFRRSLRATVSQPGNGSKLLGGRALGPPKRVVPKTPNSLLRSELNVDDSMEEDSFLVSPPPGALWNRLDTSSTGLVVVSPQAAAQIHQTLSSKKEKTDASPIFSPPLQPRKLATTSTAKKPVETSTSSSKGQWFSLEQPELSSSTTTTTAMKTTNPNGNARMDLSTEFSSTEESSEKKATPPPHLLERLERGTKSSQMKKDVTQVENTNGLAMDFTDMFSPDRNDAAEHEPEDMFTPRPTSAKLGNGLMDFSHMFSDSKAKKASPPPSLVERLQNPTRKGPTTTATMQGSTTKKKKVRSPVMPAKPKHQPSLESKVVEVTKEVSTSKPTTTTENKDTGLMNVSHMFLDSKKKKNASSPSQMVQRFKNQSTRSPTEKLAKSEPKERAGSPVVSPEPKQQSSSMIEEASTPQPTVEKKDCGLMDFSHMFSDSKKTTKASLPLNLAKRLEKPRRSHTTAVQPEAESKKMNTKRTALASRPVRKNSQQSQSSNSTAAKSRPALPRTEKTTSPKTRTKADATSKISRHSSKENITPSPLIKKPGKYGAMATPSSRRYGSLATPSSHRLQRKAETSKMMNNGAVDEWAEKQSETFLSWLNYTFHPSEGEDQQDTDGTNDAGSPSCSGLRMVLIHRRLAQSRMTASGIFYGDSMQKVKNTIHAEISRGRLSIRSDRDLYYDLSLRRQVTALLQSYTTPWLRLGLEVMFGECIVVDNSAHDPSKSHFSRMRSTLGKFIVNRVLSDSAVLKKYTKGKCKIPSGRFEKQFRAEIRSLVVYRIMVLIIFLDQAKMANVLDKVPRFFAKGSEVKSSREVLLAFCRACLSSEGDFIKHLSRIGLKVSYKQDPVDELDFHVRNLATDLRDGTCLNRVTEIITQVPAKSLMTKLRLPSISRLQKLHNLNLALSSLREFGVMVPDDVNAHHIVDGHREMVLKVMWSLIAHSCMEKLLEGDLVEQEISNVVRSNQARRKVQGLLAKDSEVDEHQTYPIDAKPEEILKSLLFRWCQAVCSSFGVTLTDVTTSFADGKVLCLLVHYYHPAVIRLDEILPTSSDDVEGLSEEQAIHNERANSTMASRRASQLGGIPKMIPYCDSKNPPNERSMLLCLTYLCSRLMESSKEIFATILIQECYRKYREKVLHEKKQEAAMIIFNFWLEHKHNYFNSQKRRYARAVALVETFVLANRQALKRMKRIRLEKERRLSAAIKIQRIFRGAQARDKYNELWEELQASIRIQTFFRLYEAKKVVMGLLQIRDAASCIQQTWRGFVCRQRYYNLVYSAITIQSFARGMIVREQTRRQEHAAVLIQRTWWNFVDSWRMNWAATTIQRLWRGFNARIDFERKLIEEEEAFEQAATIIQGAWRGFAAQVEFQLDLLDIISVQNLARKKIATRRRNDIVKSVAVLQGAARYWLAKRSFETKFQERDAAITCQCAIRCWLSSRELSNRQQRYKCATLIQSHWRRYAERMAFSLLLTTTIYIQAFVRGHHDRRQMVLWSQSASTIQRTWRSFSLDVQNENACTEIQRTWRAYSSRKKYEISRVSAVSVQRCWRGYAVRDALEKQQFAATILQSCWRGFMSRMNFQLDLLEIIFVQNAVRRYLAKREAAVRREATQVIQNVSRCFLAARLADTLRKQMIEWETSHKAAICIQSSLRCYIAQKQFQQLLKAVTLTQSWWRSQSAVDCFRRFMIGVILLQAQVRGRKQRQDVVVLHEKASIIQGHWRCFTSCIKYRLMVGDIITVQSVIRRHLAIQARRNQSIAAAKIQSLFRGHAVRSSLAIYHCHASVIQSAFRGFMARISYSLDIIDIVTIQSLARRWLARRIVGKRQSSLLKIQSVTRRWIGYRRVSSLRIHVERERTESNMACKIQACYIGYKTRRAISVRNEKATLIQTAFRGFFARSSFMADRLDIVAVQSLARRWLVRQSMSMQQESAIMLQSIVRQRIATQKVAHLKMMKSLKYRQSHSSTLIQSLWRGHRDRQIAAEHAAARKIQKTWRCFVTHIDFLVQVMSVLSMQACVRRFLAQRSYEKRYQNLVRLQAFFRGNIVRCELRRKNQAAIVIQSAYRSFSERTAFLIEKYAATTIQRVTRGVLTRINIEIEHFAATEIQRVWRGYDQFVEYVYVVFAAIKIQSHMRRCLAKNACESLQLEVWADQSYLKKKASIIQQAYRGYVLRKKMSRAASTIQRAFRDYLALWRANMLSRATIRLQAAFRAQAVRRKRNRSVVNVARKVLRAKKRAMEDPKQRLGCRTSIALTVLETSTSLAEIMDAVKTLESSTRLSINCCEVFTNTSAANILLDLIRACNRSLPHVELVHWILLTLENVGQHDRFLHCFSHCNSAEVFLDKVQMFRDKDGIFCLSISLLRRMIYTDQSVLDFCGTHEHLKRLKGIHKLSMRRTRSATGVQKGRKKKLQIYERREIFDRPEALKALGELINYIEVPVGTPATVLSQKHFTF